VFPASHADRDGAAKLFFARIAAFGKDQGLVRAHGVGVIDGKIICPYRQEDNVAPSAIRRFIA
jgi:hypothetical protein